jgi:hypothetical protein
MNEITATRIKHRGKTAIRVSGITRVQWKQNAEGYVTLGGARANRCDWVIVRSMDPIRRCEVDENGGLFWVDVPAGEAVHGIRACEAAAYAEADRLPGGRVIAVQS